MGVKCGGWRQGITATYWMKPQRQEPLYEVDMVTLSGCLVCRGRGILSMHQSIGAYVFAIISARLHVATDVVCISTSKLLGQGLGI